MSTERGRAWRRHQRARMFNRAFRKLKDWEGDREHDPEHEWLLWRARRSFNNMQVCSCWVCGNPRRSGWGPSESLTMQEHRAYNRFIDGMQEYDEMLDPDKCDPEVFKHGTSIGIFDMKKDEAQELCKKLTEEKGYKHDWHFAAGRVVIKALKPKG